jgi:hypothetical protein
MKTLLETVYNYIDETPENDMDLSTITLLLEEEIPLLEDVREFQWRLYLNYNCHLTDSQKSRLSTINKIITLPSYG